MGDSIVDLVSKPYQLSVDREDDRVINTDVMVEDLSNRTLVGRVISKRNCNIRFIKNIFGKMWRFENACKVKILKEIEGRTYL